MSQRDIVADILNSGQTINAMEAWEDYRIQRLSAVIYDLRHKEDLNVVSFPRSCDDNVDYMLRRGSFKVRVEAEEKAWEEYIQKDIMNKYDINQLSVE